MGTRVAKGIPLDDIAEYLNLTALFRNQWGFRPEERGGRRGVQGAVKATLREQMAKAREADILVPAGGLRAISPANRRATT